jgi:Putative adhesin
MKRKIATMGLMFAAMVPMLSACHIPRAYAQSDRRDREDDRRSDERSDKPFAWSGTVREGHWVYVRSLNGPVRVEQGTGDKVEVRAEKRWRRGDPEDVRITVRQVGSAGGDVIICALWNDRSTCDEDGYHSHNSWLPNFNNRNDVQVEFIVRLPAGVKINASTVNGGIEIDGATSNVVAHTVNGTVQAKSSGGPVSAHTTNGDIIVRSAALNNDRTEYTTTNGSITVELGGSVNADVDMRTVNGRLSSDFPLTVEGSFSPRRLHATLGKGGATLRLSTVNGSIRLRKLS